MNPSYGLPLFSSVAMDPQTPFIPPPAPRPVNPLLTPGGMLRSDSGSGADSSAPTSIPLSQAQPVDQPKPDTYNATTNPNGSWGIDPHRTMGPAATPSVNTGTPHPGIEYDKDGNPIRLGRGYRSSHNSRVWRELSPVYDQWKAEQDPKKKARLAGQIRDLYSQIVPPGEESSLPITSRIMDRLSEIQDSLPTLSTAGKKDE